MKRRFTDQMQREIVINYPPQRIICLVPSLTELLFYLGLGPKLVGITKFCVYPSGLTKHIPKVGGTKKLHLDRFEEMKPDLIIANKEENEREQIQQLSETYPVWLSDIRSIDQALEMIRQIGLLTNTTLKANRLVRQLKEHFETLSRPARRIRAAYLIWYRPLMAAGSDTFIHAMLDLAGFVNVFADRQRYPEIRDHELVEARPQLILLSSEPFPFREKHLAEFEDLCPEAKIKLVDGTLFSWYGSRLLQSVPYLNRLNEVL